MPRADTAAGTNVTFNMVSVLIRRLRASQPTTPTRRMAECTDQGGLANVSSGACRLRSTEPPSASRKCCASGPTKPAPAGKVLGPRPGEPSLVVCQGRRIGMAQCEVCGNEYDKTFEVTLGGQRHVFDSFECASAPGPPALTAAARSSGTAWRRMARSTAVRTAPATRARWD